MEFTRLDARRARGVVMAILAIIIPIILVLDIGVKILMMLEYRKMQKMKEKLCSKCLHRKDA